LGATNSFISVNSSKDSTIETQAAFEEVKRQAAE